MKFKNLKHYVLLIITALFLSGVFFSVAEAKWTKELDVSFGANHDVKHIYINGRIYEQRDVGLDFMVNG